MAGGDARRQALALILVLAGCWKENPAFLTGADVATTGTSTGTTSSDVPSTGVVEPPATTTSTGTSSTTQAITGETSSTGEVTTTSTSTSTTTGTSSTTDDQEPACGAHAYGEAVVLGRYWFGLTPEPVECQDIEGRNFKLVGEVDGLVEAIACSEVPALGCALCDPLLRLRFGFTTPVPDGTLDVAPCVYMAAHGVNMVDDDKPCRYEQAAIWWDGSVTPYKAPPLAIFGHNTVVVEPAVKALTGQALVIEPVVADVPCGCVDVNNCCVEKAVEYSLGLKGEGLLDLLPGTFGPLPFAGAPYTAYAGRSHATGACQAGPLLDWWLLRDM